MNNNGGSKWDISHETSLEEISANQNFCFISICTFPLERALTLNRVSCKDDRYRRISKCSDRNQCTGSILVRVKNFSFMNQYIFLLLRINSLVSVVSCSGVYLMYLFLVPESLLYLIHLGSANISHHHPQLFISLDIKFFSDILCP